MRIAKLLNLVLILVFSLGLQVPIAYSGLVGGAGTLWNSPDQPTNSLLSYFDLGNRETMVQVTNTDSVNSVIIHVQIFADLNNCEDRDFTDTLTPNETHVYDIRNLVSANGNPINFQIPADSHGFVIISAGDGMGSELNQIIGNFRIIDSSGYEYRVNSSHRSNSTSTAPIELVGRFTDDWGAGLSDVVGVRVVDPTQLPDGTEDYTVQITDPYELFMFDDEETGTSCGEAQFGCDEFPGDGDPFTPVNYDDDIDFPEFTADFINQGINDVFTNSRDGRVLCSGDFNTDGYINLIVPVLQVIGTPVDDFVGFIGLNDGAGRGSMDRFKVVALGSQ